MSKAVWDTLSQINVNNKIEKKGRFSYLSWAWAWEQLITHYPDSSYSFREVNYFQDGTAEVWCDLTVDGVTRSMWLAVMNNSNAAIKNPTSTDINKTRMRCLVKAMAMFGLGHYIYAGEDVPQELPKEPEPYLNFEHDAGEMIQLILSGKKTAKQLLDGMKIKYIISDEVAAKISALSKHEIQEQSK